MQIIDDEIKRLKKRIRELQKEKEKLLIKRASLKTRKRYKKTEEPLNVKGTPIPRMPRQLTLRKKYLQKLQAEERKFEKQVFKLSFENTLKEMKYLTKYKALQARYNKAIQVATELGLNKGYQKVTLNELMKQGFNVSTENIKALADYMTDVIQKFEGQAYDPNYLMGMLQFCVKKAANADFYELSNRILNLCYLESTFQALSTRIPQYSEQFYELINELYFVCTVDEDRSNQILDELEMLIQEVNEG